MLLALDFAGGLVDVVSQPMRLRLDTSDKRRSHTPDFLAMTRSGVWLIDVRPEPLIEDKDRESFAAAAEVALACGWHYVVAARWRDHVCSSLDAFSSRRRPLSDPLGLRPALLGAARTGQTFGELAATAAYEPLARGPAAAPALASQARSRPGPAAGRPFACGGSARSGGMTSAGAVLDLSPGAGVVLERHRVDR